MAYEQFKLSIFNSDQRGVITATVSKTSPLSTHGLEEVQSSEGTLTTTGVGSGENEYEAVELALHDLRRQQGKEDY